ncbi:MAG: ATP-binding cassette domain-containing protein, partial [Actinobacteria bacterium]|nr:ATP-binding cassette domain-containing protein [Actinomycetota bacterium]
SVFGRTYGARVSGRVFKDGTEVQLHSVQAAIRNGIAYATEDRKRFGLNLIDTIQHNVSAAAIGKVSVRGVIDAGREARMAEQYRRDLNIKTPSITALAGKLSGGNQQKVVLSKWIFADPDVLILDEPTRGIDVGAKYEIYTIINRLADAGKAVIFISSELPELIGTCDRIYALSQGRVTGEVARADATQELLMTYMTMEKDVIAR